MHTINLKCASVCIGLCVCVYVSGSLISRGFTAVGMRASTVPLERQSEQMFTVREQYRGREQRPAL